MKKKAIIIVCLIVLSFASIVEHQELEQFVYFYVNSNIEIEGKEYRAPVLVLCKTTDCFSKSSLHNTDVSTMKNWSFEKKGGKSSKKALFDALETIELDYPGIYGVRIIFLSFYGRISREQWWRLRPIIPIDDENF